MGDLLRRPRGAHPPLPRDVLSADIILMRYDVAMGRAVEGDGRVFIDWSGHYSYGPPCRLTVNGRTLTGVTSWAGVMDRLHALFPDATIAVVRWWMWVEDRCGEPYTHRLQFPQIDSLPIEFAPTSL